MHSRLNAYRKYSRAFNVHSCTVIAATRSILKMETKETLINQKSRSKTEKGKSGMDFHWLDRAMRDASIPSPLSKTTRQN